MNSVPFATRRTALRPLSAAHEALYRALYTRPDVMAHVGRPLTAREARRQFLSACRLNAAASPREFRWAVLDPGSGEGLGMLALLLDAADPCSAELGVMLLPLAQGQGIGRELVDALALAAFAPGDGCVQRLRARYAPSNGAMAATLAGAGFEPGPSMGAWATMALARSRWLALRA